VHCARRSLSGVSWSNPRGEGSRIIARRPGRDMGRPKNKMTRTMPGSGGDDDRDSSALDVHDHRSPPFRIDDQLDFRAGADDHRRFGRRRFCGRRSYPRLKSDELRDECLLFFWHDKPRKPGIALVLVRQKPGFPRASVCGRRRATAFDAPNVLPSKAGFQLNANVRDRASRQDFSDVQKNSRCRSIVP